MKKVIKKIVLALLALIVLISIAGCSAEEMDKLLNVTSVTIKDEYYVVNKGANYTIPAADLEILPETVLNKKVEWSIDNTGIATVNKDTGSIYGVSNGVTTLTATSVSNPNIKDDCIIIVLP